MIKVVLFDADDVLINGDKFAEVLERDFNIDKIKTAPFFEGKFQDCLVGKADLQIELNPFLKSWGWNKSVEEFLEYWFKSEHAINENLIDHVKKLTSSGLSYYIATNQEKYRTEYILNEMGLANVFQGCFSSADLGFTKPHEKFYSEILRRLGVKPEEVLFIDDKLSNIEAAQKININTHLFTNFKSLEEAFKKLSALKDGT